MDSPLAGLLYVLFFLNCCWVLGIRGQETQNIADLIPQPPPDLEFIYNTTFPPFANEGGPIDLTLSLYESQTSYIGMLLPSGFVSSLYLGDGQFMMQMGKFLSWECTGNEGEYRATLIRRDIFSNGTVVVANRCELGKITPEFYYWVSSTVTCPEVGTAFPESSETTILYDTTTIAPPNFSNLTCKQGATVTGLNTTGTAGLDPVYLNELGVYSLNTTIPPPPRAVPGVYTPPPFQYKGITPVVNGIWDLAYADAFRTIASDGFCIILYNKTLNTFTQALGKYDSYECLVLGNNNGYRSVASQSSFNQTGVLFLSPAPGCSAAVFLTQSVTQVAINVTFNATCPVPSRNAPLSVLITSIPGDNGDDLVRDDPNRPLCISETGGINSGASTMSETLMIIHIMSVGLYFFSWVF
ncbi:hypothetical protein PSENEW3n2_00005128 [Picochlorum sp. SENEW3]|nr:hypothetical protein PSENEW3n2_00005128 [Picochlorum sp. SENEW3]WPT17123.1 hypothetical protein PSENEW3_00005128 [Picochlorum sp. SENEW3]